jgi:hypothetical protein
MGIDALACVTQMARKSDIVTRWPNQKTENDNTAVTPDE